MIHSENVYLIGPMGAGKTTIGRMLAKELDKQFFDSDREIEIRTGVDIPLIFEYEGEEGFRRRESEVLAELTKLRGVILATGGGVILREENRNVLSRNGFVVYLRCPVDKQLERTRKDTHRPLLNTPDPAACLQALLQVRAPLYESTADITIDTGIYSSRQAVKKILKAYLHYNHENLEH